MTRKQKRLSVIAGALGGWAWGMIPAMLRNWFGASEILVFGDAVVLEAAIPGMYFR